ncbi:hypothetical protein SAMN04488550_0248 [Gordonia malaquae]|uniref:Uncharacterized protein n=1 Tax=Gordonia malaquae NBRC 108250 TaxID=1223542 RepID=M3TG05_GORML|nr:hypothetical protein [Gordonia malaquae]GAC80391.1 hypothetical protein GM1_017_00490 [Gordonia malaquae NBRC 108250]SEB52348.1 hypothetical protein SAMN04488550_0248 [Gordonia malaquae]
MATYVLDSSNTARLPRGPLAVSLTTSDAGVHARITARSESGAAVPSVPNGAHMVILPSITELTTVGAVPAAGLDRFAPNTILHLSMTPEGALGRGGDTASLAPRDVSGLAFVDLATVAPEPDGALQITTLLDVEDVPLPPVAHAARIATRGVLGVDHVRASSEVSVRCIIDLSTSMSPAFDQRAVAACADIVAGLSAVISGQTTVDWLATLPGSTEYTRVGLAELSARAGDPPTAGLGLAADLVPGLSAPVAGPTLTVVITDGPVPAVVTPNSHVVGLVVATGAAAAHDAAVCLLQGDDTQARLADDAPAVTAIVTDLIRSARGKGLLA